MRPNLILAGIAALCLAGGVPAQQRSTTALVVQVVPEARLNLSRIALSFRVSADGMSDVTSTTQTVAAWVRALPGQPIRVTASAGALGGQSGSLPLSALRWSGSVAGATGGGQQAACTDGSFETGATQDLVAAWARSGTLTCTVTFSLADPRTLPPGLYTGWVSLAIR